MSITSLTKAALSILIQKGFWVFCRTHLHWRRSTRKLAKRCSSASTRFCSSARFRFIVRCCPPDISSVTTDHDELFGLPVPNGEADCLFRGTVTAYAGPRYRSGLSAWASPHCRPRRQNSSYSISSRSMIHNRIPSLRPAATVAFPNPFCASLRV